jgi:hypothetical protein
VVKVVISVDRDELLSPGQAWPLLARYLTVQMADVPGLDPDAKIAPRRWGAAARA